MVALSPFEDAEFGLAPVVSVNSGGNGDGENRKIFGCSVEGRKIHGWVLV